MGIDTVAEELAQDIRGDEDSLPWIIRRHSAYGAVRWCRWSPSLGESRVGILRGQLVIHLRRDLAVHRARWLAAWHLADWCLGRMVDDGARRSLRARVAAAILMPREEALALRDDPEELAEERAVTRGAALLRIAELTGRPTAIVTPRWHRLRGERSPLLPDDPEALRAYAASALRSRSVRKVRLDDEPHRGVALVVGALPPSVVADVVCHTIWRGMPRTRSALQRSDIG